MPFDPTRKPRLPDAIKNLLEYREGYFNPRIGEDEDGFTVQDAESLGWNVDLFHASKHFPGRGLVEVRAGRDVLDSDEGRYGVLKVIYEYELKEHQRAQARARETYLRLVRAERLKLQALDAAKGGESYKKAIKHARQALRISAELDAFSLLELPQEYLDELNETKPLDAARKERACPATQANPRPGRP